MCTQDSQCEQAKGCGSFNQCSILLGKCVTKLEQVSCVSSRDCQQGTKSPGFDNINKNCKSCYGGACMPPKASSLEQLNGQITKLFLALSPLSFNVETTSKTDWVQFGFNLLGYFNTYISNGKTEFQKLASTFPHSNHGMLFSTIDRNNNANYNKLILEYFLGYFAMRAGFNAAIAAIPEALCPFFPPACPEAAQDITAMVKNLAGDAVYIAALTLLDNTVNYASSPTNDTIKSRYSSGHPFFIYNDIAKKTIEESIIRVAGNLVSSFIYMGVACFKSDQSAACDIATFAQGVLFRFDMVLMPLFILGAILISMYYQMIPLFFWSMAIIAASISFLYFIVAFPFIVFTLALTDKNNESLIGKITDIVGTLIVFVMRPVLFIVAFVFAMCFIWIVTFLFEIMIVNLHNLVASSNSALGWFDLFTPGMFAIFHATVILAIAIGVFSACLGFVSNVGRYYGGQDAGLGTGAEAGKQLAEGGQDQAKAASTQIKDAGEKHAQTAKEHGGKLAAFAAKKAKKFKDSADNKGRTMKQHLKAKLTTTEGLKDIRGSIKDSVASAKNKLGALNEARKSPTDNATKGTENGSPGKGGKDDPKQEKPKT